jgi:choline dehydrogenase
MREAFDYVIIGAGSAGCVVADRLSEDAAVTVLVLEAGGRDSNPWIHVPIGYARTFFDKRVNWCLESEPCPELGGRRLYMPCGKVLGGSSSINGLLYVRGQAQDYDGWASLGNPGWSWREVLPYFTRSEDQETLRDTRHGSGGPLPVSDQRERNPLCRAFLDAGAAAGFRRTNDFNGGDQEGLGWFQVTARRGRRKSAATTFLRRAAQRPNVVVRTHALAGTIIVRDGAATGVSYERQGQPVEVDARRGVVLCAGAFHSPAVLQRSGIGHPGWLREAGITVTHALPGVGANLQDHLQAKLVFRTREPITLNDRTASLLGKARMGFDYLARRRGPLTTAGAQAGGFVRTRLSPDRADIQFHVFTFSSADLRKGLDRFSGMTISACQLRPESRGTVRVRSGRAAEAPIIDTNALAAELDRRTLVEGLSIGRAIAGTNPLKAALVAEERPGIPVASDDELGAFVRETASPVFHPAGTCRMGSDAGAVVNHRLQVHGVERLTVADSSIMPRLVSGNTNAACIMIGERAADFLRMRAQ